MQGVIQKNKIVLKNRSTCEKVHCLDFPRNHSRSHFAGNKLFGGGSLEPRHRMAKSAAEEMTPPVVG